MGNLYRLVGSVEPGSRIDRVEVESPSADYPQGKVLELHDPAQGRIGNVVELDPDQTDKLSNYVELEQVTQEQVDNEALGVPIDQPDLDRSSDSTDDPPQTGHVPTEDEVNAMSKDALDAEIASVRARNPTALDTIKGNATNEDKRAALLDYYQIQGV